MKQDKSFVTYLDPVIEQNVTPAKILKMNTLIRNWFDRNSHILASTGLGERPMFNPNETKIVYEITGLDEKQVMNAIAQSNAIDSSWKMFTASGFASYIAYVMYIRHLLKINRPKDAQLVYMYLAMRMYATIHGKHFLFTPKKEVIDFTVSQLNNKFDIKRLGSFAKAFQKLVDTWHLTYTNDILSTKDEDIINYLTTLRTRIKGFVQKFFNEFKKVWQSGSYLNTDIEETWGDDDSDKKERGSDSDAIYSRAEGFQVWFVSNPIDEQALASWCRQSDVAFNDVLNVFQNVQKEQTPIMQHMAASLLSLYFEHSKDGAFKGICSTQWIPFALSQFIKTNTDNPLIIQLKAAFDLILTKYSYRFTQSKRDATKSGYRKAILLYLAYSLQKFICRG